MKLIDTTLSSNELKESVVQLLSKNDDQKTRKNICMTKNFTRNNIFVPDDGESLKVKEARNIIVDKLLDKPP